MVTQRRDGTVEFRFFRPHAHQVVVAGDFNGWHLTSTPMTKGPDGWWCYQLRLEPGCYQFRYVSDDQWYTDFAAFGIEPSPFGLNSVLKVDPPRRFHTETTPSPIVRFPHISEAADPSSAVPARPVPLRRVDAPEPWRPSEEDDDLDALTAAAERPIRTRDRTPLAAAV